jgi:cobalt-zinc-cadmium efflux system membrane fusion protein
MNGDTINKSTQAGFITRNRSLLTFTSILSISVIAISFMFWRHSESVTTKQKTEAEKVESKSDTENEVALSSEAVSNAGIEISEVTQLSASNLLQATGTIEVNQEQTQQATPLVSGRIERINVALGNHVRAGEVLAMIASPEVAELRGKFHEEETHLAIAQRKLERVQKSENQVAVLQAKARLNEAETTLNRTRRLVDIDMAAKKDLVSAETAYEVAKAEYDFQSNIVLIRDLQEAKAEVETAKIDLSHVRDQLRALGAPVPENEEADHKGNTAVIPITAPMSGVITERMVNVGAGIESGTPLFTIANLSTIWVIANVPESEVGRLQIGSPAEIHSKALSEAKFTGKVSYIDPQLSESTRTARVRVEVINPNEQLKVGVFVEVSFQTNLDETNAKEKELFVASEAVQRIDDRSVVFIPKQNEPGHFEVRDVELGQEIDARWHVIKGLAVGEHVVTKGSFALKTKLLKKQLQED